MRCLYCDRQFGLFKSGKDLFCSEEHEELYRDAATHRLQESGANDLAQLLKFVQADSGTSVGTPAEVAVGVDFASQAEVGTGSSPAKVMALPEMAGVWIQAPGEPVADLASAITSAAVAEEKDRRRAPRVEVGAIVKVASLRNPEREVSCILMDTSETGIQFNAYAEFPAGEILIAELPDQLALAEVRYSRVSGDSYAMGAECVQFLPRNDVPPTSTRAEQAEVLVKTLCGRAQNGFSDAGDRREHALERTAKILEIWQSQNSQALRRTGQVDSGIAPNEKLDQADVPASTQKAQRERQSSIGSRRTFAVVASGLVVAGLLTVYFVQFRKSVAATAPPVNTAAMRTPQVEQKPEVKPQTAAAPKVEPALKPVPQAIAATAPGPHRAHIKALEATWIGASADGHNLFGATIPKGSTRELEYSKFGFLHVGNAAGVEISVDGQSVPMGSQSRLRLVELTTTGFRFLRWTNDDPPQP
jgi:hypothetical protein